MTCRLFRAGIGAAFLAALSVPAHVAAKPPDLPENQTITVWRENSPPIGAVENPPPESPSIEMLPMPCEEGDVTCPYLRQQRIDRHASQFVDPQIGRDVLDNLARLQEADDLLELAKELANDGYFTEAMECCDLARALCPGSPSAQRAADTRLELALGLFQPESDTEEAAEQEPETSDQEPGNEQLVGGLMKSCHLLVSQGMHHQAAELARQAFALDPQRVLADPLIYKMHLLAEPQPVAASEASEPPTCPYCGSSGKPIRAIVAEPKKHKANTTTLRVPALPKVDYEVVPALDRVLTESMKPSTGVEEASEDAAPANEEQWLRDLIHDSPLAVGADAEGGLRLSGECTLGGNVYHLRYRHGCLAIWKTSDASK
jgi:tetratricopeptide (TPR) repeat protein